jgi:hypothetical protein
MSKSSGAVNIKGIETICQNLHLCHAFTVLFFHPSHCSRAYSCLRDNLVETSGHLKQFKGEGKDIRPLPVVLDDHEEWEVSSIDGEQTKKGVVEYLVRWKGYGDHERTWEPLSHLEHAPDELLRWRASRPDNITKARTTASRTTTPARSSSRKKNALTPSATPASTTPATPRQSNHDVSARPRRLARIKNH